MKHLNEAELLEHYYDESASPADCERHLKSCAACAKHYADLRRDLDGVKPIVPPVRGEDYGEHVWQSIRNSLPVYEKDWLDPILAATCVGSRLRTAACRGIRCRTPMGAEANALGCRGCRSSGTAARGGCRSRRSPRPL